MRIPRTAAAATIPLLLALAACAPAEEKSADPAPTSEAGDPAECAADKVLTDGKLTVATDSPAYEPWFAGNDPSNGKGFESAVAYAVADKLGFAEGDVTWVKVPFNNSYAPGKKKFDFDINQISITAERLEVVDFSEGYYAPTQAIIALNGSKASKVADFDGLETFKLGAQTGTTSLTAIREEIEPTAKPLVFEDTNAAKQALLNGQVDAIVADLPTALYITAVEIEDSTIVGQFAYDDDAVEEFGMLFEKGNALVGCVDAALAELKEDGTLAALEQEWLSDTADVPVLD
ncbi:ABC transporter substrate-binding protein [Nocardioides daphniae]|uniref:Amino acid ABC transporter substrate-binding protein n=1 Tax=Nocardioides daphniae TaxID=402297 RepID=A0A4P7U7K3_9ACTN|nr:ABC transporter substrate-binding protein [Nocardioides daphniae]QCC76183.1 amino acid ABC transporter substrate-binding protein [Nocardioides daphniae]GGD09250.1 amino acid ABC transporter substrate-binding protein [Nocardioides daphniae]